MGSPLKDALNSQSAAAATITKEDQQALLPNTAHGANCREVFVGCPLRRQDQHGGKTKDTVKTRSRSRPTRGEMWHPKPGFLCA